MTYSEFFEIAKDKPWKVVPCHSGTECWCRLIEVCGLERSDDEDSYINNSASIPKEFAEYLVELHNKNIGPKNPLSFKSKEEMFTFLYESAFGRELIDECVCDLENFTDREINREVERRGYYYFEDESDIENYVEDSMDKYVFDDGSDIEDWVKENSSTYDELTTSGPSGNYRSDCIESINEIVETRGWEWLHRRLELM
jgi:hypothetical protein